MERQEYHESGNKMDYAALDAAPELGRFVESGQRVEITWKKGYGDFRGYGARTDGKKARGFIGRTTGWKPGYILLLTRSILLAEFSIHESWARNTIA